MERLGTSSRRSRLVNETSLISLIAHIRAEKQRKTLLGTDESDELSSMVAEALLVQAARRMGGKCSLGDLLRSLGGVDQDSESARVSG